MGQRLKPGWCGWRIAKAQILAALQNGQVSHERRPNQQQINQLWAGNVSSVFVSDLVSGAKGTMVTFDEWDKEPDIQVWIIRAEGWYVKCYIKGGIVFISVHK